MTSQVDNSALPEPTPARRRFRAGFACLVIAAVWVAWIFARHNRYEATITALSGMRANIQFTSPPPPLWMQWLGLSSEWPASRHISGIEWPSGTSSDNLLAELPELNGLDNLTVLLLPGGEVSDQGLAHIAGLTSLHSLDLSQTRISDAGLRHLAGMTGLKNLNLRGTHVTDAAIPELKKFSKLSVLNVIDTEMTPAGIHELQQVLPSLVLVPIE
jgi:hypothetical protein